MNGKVTIHSQSLSPKERGTLYQTFPTVFQNNGIHKGNFDLTFENRKAGPKILYHYTSIDTLQQILNPVDDEKPGSIGETCNSLILRGTNIEYLNDVSEFKLAAKIMAELFSVRKNSLNNSDRNLITESSDEVFWQRMATSSGNRTTPFVTSFSEDSDNLPMWSTYGQNGNGVAIGIEIPECHELGNGNTTIGRCIYDSDLVRSILGPPAADLSNYCITEDDIRAINVNDIYGAMASFFGFLKHPAYEYEHEWRLIKSCPTSDPGKEIKFQEKNGLLKPYIENKFSKSVLKEIVIGPCAKIDLSEKSLKMRLERAGYGFSENDLYPVKVKRSEIPFRII